MKPARYNLRVHGAIFCAAVLFGVFLIFLGFIGRDQLLVSAAFLFVHGEFVFFCSVYCGSVLEGRVDSRGRGGS